MNFAELCLQVLPGLDINRIRYFTALVKPRPADPHIRLRQEIYIRALETLPNLTVHYGHFLQSEVSMPLVSAPARGTRSAMVIKTEEKGSDVNIATYMLADAFRKDCDQLIVITNDSDLAEPVRIINKELRIPVGIFNPQTNDTALRRSRITGKPLKPARPSIQLNKFCEVQSGHHIRGTAFAHGPKSIPAATDRRAGPDDYEAGILVSFEQRRCLRYQRHRRGSR